MSAFVQLIVRGRLAYFASMALGIVLLVIGLAMGPNMTFVIGGVAFFVIGLALLIISYATGGAAP